MRMELNSLSDEQKKILAI